MSHQDAKRDLNPQHMSLLLYTKSTIQPLLQFLRGEFWGMMSLCSQNDDLPGYNALDSCGAYTGCKAFVMLDRRSEHCHILHFICQSQPLLLQGRRNPKRSTADNLQIRRTEWGAATEFQLWCRIQNWKHKAQDRNIRICCCPVCAWSIFNVLFSLCPAMVAIR